MTYDSPLDAIVDKISNGKSDNSIDIARAKIALDEAVKRHDAARDEYDGYSWGWHGAKYIEEMDKAKQNLQYAQVKDTIQTIKCILKDPELVQAIKDLD